MRGSRYLVLGTGVGKAIAYYLANSKDTDDKVFIGDTSYDAAAKAISNMPFDRILEAYKTYKLIPVNFSIDSDPTAYQSFFSKFDVVISAIPAKYNLELAKLAIKAGVHFCDLGGVIEVAQEMLKLNQEAIEKGVSIGTDMGIMPGTGTMMGKLAIADLKHIQSLSIGAGGLPQNPIPPTFYQQTFALEGLEHICYDQPVIVNNGQIEIAEPFSGYRRFKIPELANYGFGGVVEGFNTAGASVSPWEFQQMGIGNFQELTFRWPRFADFARKIPRSEFKNVMGRVLKPTSKDNPDLLWLEVNTVGTDFNGREVEKTWTLLDKYDQATGFSAMQRTTGFSTAIFARLMAQGKTKLGVNTADNALSNDQMIYLLDELQTNCGMKIRKSTVTT